MFIVVSDEIDKLNLPAVVVVVVARPLLVVVV
jgi:hypothetical protein